DSFFAARTGCLQNQTRCQSLLRTDISEIGKKALPADLFTPCQIRLLSGQKSLDLSSQETARGRQLRPTARFEQSVEPPLVGLQRESAADQMEMRSEFRDRGAVKQMFQYSRRNSALHAM